MIPLRSSAELSAELLEAARSRFVPAKVGIQQNPSRNFTRRHRTTGSPPTNDQETPPRELSQAVSELSSDVRFQPLHEKVSASGF